jgi:hypothetical protein
MTLVEREDHAVIVTDGRTEVWPCTECDRELTTCGGLGVHRRRRHPCEYHDEAVDGLAERKFRWSAEETHVLAQA